MKKYIAPEYINEKVEVEEPKEENNHEETPQPEDTVVEPTEEQDEPKSEEKPKMKEKKSGWMDRFRNWVDDMFTDEYI